MGTMDKDKIANIIIFFQIVIMAYFIGKLIAYSPGLSIGIWIKGLTPVCGIGLLIVVTSSLPRVNFRLSSLLMIPAVQNKKNITQVCSSIAFGLLVGLISVELFQDYTVTFILFSAFGLFLMTYFYVFVDTKRSILFFLISNPILTLADYYLKVGYPAYRQMFSSHNAISFYTFLYCLFTIAAMVVQRKQLLIKTFTGKYTILFFIVAILASMFSINPLKSIEFTFNEIISHALLYFVVINLIDDVKSLKLVIKSLIAATLLLTFVGIYSLSKVLPQLDRLREITEVGLPLGTSLAALSTAVAMVLPLTIAMTQFEDKTRSLIFYYFAIIAFVATIITSYSRTGFIVVALSFFSTIGIRFFRYYKKIVILFIAIICLLAWSGILNDYLPYNYGGVTKIQDIIYLSTMQYRIKAWKAGIEIIKDNPLFGIGTGMWEDYIPLYGEKMPVHLDNGSIGRGYIVDPHNFYIEIAVNMGIIGFLTYIILLRQIFKMQNKAISNNKKNILYFIAKGNSAGLLAFFIWCLVGARFTDGSFIGIGIVFWILVALGERLTEVPKVRPNYTGVFEKESI